MSHVETQQAMVRVPPGTWTVDPIHSSVGFKIKHMMIATVRGQFTEFEGTIVAAEDDPANSHAMGTVKVASIDTGNADRDAHLRSPDFFDAERYPEITFESTRIRHVSGGTFSLAGNLTIKGVTREVETGGQGRGGRHRSVGHAASGDQRARHDQSHRLRPEVAGAACCRRDARR